MGRLGDLVSEEWKRAYEGERTRVRASPAELAATAGVDEPFDANARADLDEAVERFRARAEGDDDADALVSADEGRGRCRPMTCGDVEVGMADAGMGDADEGLGGSEGGGVGHRVVCENGEDGRVGEGGDRCYLLGLGDCGDGHGALEQSRG